VSGLAFVVDLVVWSFFVLAFVAILDLDGARRD
jgi:hypothetical protein